MAGATIGMRRLDVSTRPVRMLCEEVSHADSDVSRVHHLFLERCRHSLSLDAV